MLPGNFGPYWTNVFWHFRLGVLYDNSGINTVGTGIGHDLVAILDGVTNNEIEILLQKIMVINIYQNNL